MREEFLELLRTDRAFREELRRQLLTEDVLAMPGRLDHLTELLAQALGLLRETVGVVQSLTEAQRRTEGGLQQLGERVQALTAAQLRTEEGLRELANWQRGEVGRRDGERSCPLQWGSRGDCGPAVGAAAADGASGLPVG
jgi:hypothetical protein